MGYLLGSCALGSCAHFLVGCALFVASTASSELVLDGCGYLWPGIAICDWVWVFVAGCGHLWLGVAIYGWIWLFTARCGYLWVGVVIFGWVWLFMAGCSYLWLGVARCGSV